MNNFDFQIATKIFFGKDRELEIGKIISSYGFKKALVVIGKGSVKASGLLDKVYKALDDENIKHALLEGVRPNPTIELVKEGITLARKFKPDLILAVGGGSVMDTAKCIAVNYEYDGDSFDFNLHKVVPTKALPVAAILTISASGSEMSTSCVIQDDATHIKLGFNSELVRPLFAIENPELTYSVDLKQTAYGIIDILMHTLERYFFESINNDLADSFAEGLIKSVLKAGPVAMGDPNNYEARSTLMLASSLSHNGFTSVGKRFIMPVHQLEHALSGRYPEVAHGEGLSILFLAWMKYYVEYDLPKFARFAHNVFNISATSDEESAIIAIKELEKFFESLNVATYLSDLSLPDLDIEELANIVSKDGTRVIDHHVRPMDKGAAIEIYQLALERK